MKAKGEYNIYMVVSKEFTYPETDTPTESHVSYTAAKNLPDVFKGWRKEFTDAIIAVTQIESGLSFKQCESNKIGLTIALYPEDKKHWDK